MSSWTIWISKVKVIHWPWSKVTQIQHFQTSFPEKLLGWLKPNFMWSLSGMGAQKFVQIGPGRMAKMADMPIYGKNMKNSFSLEPICRWPWKFVCSIRCSSTTKVKRQAMIRNWYNPALKTKREITKYINWRQFTKGTRGKQNEQLFPK